LQTVKQIVLLQDVPQPVQSSIEFAGEYEDLVSKASPNFNFEDIPENTMATLFYTTGTTGLPKGVYFSHRQLVLHTLAAAAQAILKPGGDAFHRKDVYMPITPMFHVHAWGLPYVATMMGCKQVYPGRYEPEMLLSLIDKEKVTFSHCVPTILHMLLSHPSAQQVDLSHWKVIIGGSALPEALCKAAMLRGVDICTGYGMSETCPVLTLAYLHPFMLDWNIDDQVKIRSKTGMPIPLVDIQIVDPEGKTLPHDGKTTGEVVVRCPWLTQGYFKEPQKSEELWRGGWLHTGDVGHIDPQGYLKITDRIKDVIKTGGEWISSLDLENVILKHEAVSEAAAIGVPHEKWGERPVVLVVIRPEYAGKVTEEDLKKFYMDFVEKGVISKWRVPDRILFVDAIPKTSVGKLDKKVMREQVKQMLQ
jgi:fatty-acyl-CoA synthase